MAPFGVNLISGSWSWKHRLYVRLFGRPFSWKKPSLVLKAIEPTADDTILDIGCRSGEYTAEMAARGARVVGLDINPSIIGKEIPSDATYHNRVALTLGDAQQLPFASNSFSKIIICDCLEHLEHDKTALGEMHRVLKPGGKLVITVPTLPGYPPHRVFARLVPLLPAGLLIHGRADSVGNTLETTDDTTGVVMARATSSDILRAFGHYRHYDEQLMTTRLEEAGFSTGKMRRFQFLFENEMMHFQFAVRGAARPAFYPIMRVIALLDVLLPSGYPGVGLLAVAEKQPL